MLRSAGRHHLVVLGNATVFTYPATFNLAASNSARLLYTRLSRDYPKPKVLDL